MILVSIFYIYKYDPIISVCSCIYTNYIDSVDTKDVNYIPIIKTTEGFQNNTKGKKNRK